jgi:hypothetical protein
MVNLLVHQCAWCNPPRVTGCQMVGSLVTISNKCEKCCVKDDCKIPQNKEMFEVTDGICDNCLKNIGSDFLGVPLNSESKT